MANILLPGAASPGPRVQARVEEVERQLVVSRELFAKPLKYFIGATPRRLMLAVVALVAVPYLLSSAFGALARISPIGWASTALGLAALSTVMSCIAQHCKGQKAMQRLAELASACLMLPVAAIGRWPVNAIYLYIGRFKRLQRIK